MRQSLSEKALPITVDTAAGRQRNTLSVEFTQMENNQPVTSLMSLRVSSTEQPSECIGCILLKRQLDALQEKAVLRQVALDLERFLKIKALGYVPLEISRTAYDRFFPNEVDDAKLNNLFLDDLIDMIPNEQFQSYLNECNLASEQELGDFRLNLQNLKRKRKLSLE